MSEHQLLCAENIVKKYKNHLILDGIYDEIHRERLNEYCHQFALDDMLMTRMNQLS